MEMSGGGDSAGMGTRMDAKTVLGPISGSAGETTIEAAWGAGSSGIAGAGAHVEQHIDLCPQSPLGSSPHPW
jgi:hypothetical protein